MATSNPGSVGADTILRHIDSEAAAVGIEVTVYLPWGVATGITVPGSYFGQYVAKFFSMNDADDVAGRIGALEAEQPRIFLHLRKARCYVAGTVVEHDSCAFASPMFRRGPSPASRSPPLQPHPRSNRTLRRSYPHNAPRRRVAGY